VEPAHSQKWSSKVEFKIIGSYFYMILWVIALIGSPLNLGHRYYLSKINLVLHNNTAVQFKFGGCVAVVFTIKLQTM